MKKILSIVIPTYNRCEKLKKNLELLNNIIKSLKYSGIEIIISNNNSSDNTFNELENIKNKIDINFKVYNQNENIGVVKNIEFCLEKSNGKFVMFLGDDDFISKEYLQEVYRLIKEEKDLTGIIGNNYLIDSDGDRISSFTEHKIEETQFYNNSIFGRIESMLNAHFISGIVILREGVLEAYKKSGVKTLYPQMYFIGFNIERGRIASISKYPIEATLYAKRYWDYDDCFLCDDICNVFLCLYRTNTWKRIICELYWLKKNKSNIKNSISKGCFRHLKYSWRLKNCTLILKSLLIIMAVIFTLPVKISNEKRNRICYKIFQKVKNRKVVIFSTSIGGYDLYNILKLNNINIDYVCDNDERKQHKFMKDIEINSFEEVIINDIKRENVIFIASKTYYNEIKLQIEKNGYSNNNIVSPFEWENLRL